LENSAFTLNLGDQSASLDTRQQTHLALRPINAYGTPIRGFIGPAGQVSSRAYRQTSYLQNKPNIL